MECPPGWPTWIGCWAPAPHAGTVFYLHVASIEHCFGHLALKECLLISVVKGRPRQLTLKPCPLVGGVQLRLGQQSPLDRGIMIQLVEGSLRNI